MVITQLNVPQWAEPANIIQQVFKLSGKLELWQQLPQEWQISEEGQRLLQQLQKESKIVDTLMPLAEGHLKAIEKSLKAYPDDYIQEEAEFFEYLVKRCDAVLDKQPDNRGLKLLRGRIRNWLKQYQIYKQQGGDNKELHQKYQDIDFTCRKYLELLKE